MKRITVKIPAKINLTLDVVGKNNGYHELSSLVCSISIFDEISVEKRKDDKILLFESGRSSGCAMTANNAYLAAQKFIEKFNVSGVNIFLNKSIPVGGGLGGSSADIAGVLIAMSKLFGITDDVKNIADSLGSDSGYMLGGGLKVIRGRGDKVFDVDGEVKAFCIVFCEDKSVSSRECYQLFDKGGDLTDKMKSALYTDTALTAIRNGDKKAFYDALNNDLLLPAISILPKIKDNLLALKGAGADAAIMTGSGSATVGIFADKKKRDEGVKALKKEFGDHIIPAEIL